MIVLALLFMLIALGAVHARAAAGNAQRSAAEGQLGALATAFSAYGTENSSYVGMTPAALSSSYGVRLTDKISSTLTITGTSASSYCAQVKDGSWYVAQQGPSAKLVAAKTPIC